MTSDVSVSLQTQINLICDEFEDAWNSGRRIGIEEFLADGMPELNRKLLLFHLLRVELELHKEHGQICRIDDYLTRFSSDSETVVAAFHSNDGAPASTTLLDPVRTSNHCDNDQQTVLVGDFSIIGTIGRGAFGTVYLTREPAGALRAVKQLDERFRGNNAAQQRFIDEGRTLESLEHPRLPQVFDVITDYPPRIVMEFLEGHTLRQLIDGGRLKHELTADLIAQAAEIIGWLHQNGIYHRDLKPSNIIVDHDGRVRVVDLGLALHVGRQRLQPPEYAGTTAYMSPEQIRGESDLLDGRADIWALGVILYESLTSHRPFAGINCQQLEREVNERAARPPREIAPLVPVEYEASCLKALSKNSADRFETALDFAQQLRNPGTWWVEERVPGFREWLTFLVRKRRATWTASEHRMMNASATKHGRRLRIGLAGFLIVCLTVAGLIGRVSEHSQEALARSFVDSLPNSKWEELPSLMDQIEAYEPWTRRELTAQWDSLTPDERKSNLRMRLALLKYDAAHVPTIYEALLTGDRQQQADLGRLLFERESTYHRHEVADYLGKQLDQQRNDPRIQAIMSEGPAPEVTQSLHDAHGFATSEFAICQKMNMADFLNLTDACAISGYRPFRVRPLRDGDGLHVAAIWKRDFQHSEFLAGMTLQQLTSADAKHRKQGDRLGDVSVYVESHGEAPALRFCATWTSSAGDDGAEYELVATESSVDYHNRAGKLVTAGYEQSCFSIASTGRSDRLFCGLWTATGVATSSQAFVFDEISADYLTDIPGLREIHVYPFDQKLTLADRFSRQLSLAQQCLAIDRSHDHPNYAGDPAWFESFIQSETFATADDGPRFLAARALFYTGQYEDAERILSGIILSQSRFRSFALPLRAQIFARRATAEAAQWSAAQKDVAELRDFFAKLPQTAGFREALVASTEAKLMILSGRVEDGVKHIEQFLVRRSDPNSFLYGACVYSVAAEAIASDNDLDSSRYIDRAGTFLETARRKGLDAGRFQTTADLEFLRTQSALWSRFAPDWPVPAYAASWRLDDDVPVQKLQNLTTSKHLRKARELGLSNFVPISIAVVPGELEEGLSVTSVWHRPPKTKLDPAARRIASAAAALARLDSSANIWHLLDSRPIPLIRSHLIHEFSVFGVDSALLVNRFVEATSPACKQALLLAVGGYTEEQFPQSKRLRVLSQVKKLYSEESDPGIHAACEWLLSLWGFSGQIANDKRDSGRILLNDILGWRFAAHRHTMVTIPGPIEFEAGAPAGLPDDTREISRGKRVSTISDSFEISWSEVTIGQMNEFDAEYEPDIDNYKPLDGDAGADLPARVNFFLAAAYANWLSKKDGIPKTEWCYLPNEDGKYAERMRITTNHTSRTGYRLPTDLEWEYACRAGTSSTWAHGESMDLLNHYAWTYQNSDKQPQQVRRLKPNPFGLFDMSGNVLEWCHTGTGNESEQVILRNTRLTARGGSYALDGRASSAYGGVEMPPYSRQQVGFRVARTIRKEQ